MWLYPTYVNPIDKQYLGFMSCNIYFCLLLTTFLPIFVVSLVVPSSFFGDMEISSRSCSKFIIRLWRLFPPRVDTLPYTQVKTWFELTYKRLAIAFGVACYQEADEHVISTLFLALFVCVYWNHGFFSLVICCVIYNNTLGYL